ncbi:hypothetical protein ACIGNX_30905 [Actinosynnema sp. NPDC053489]|uniref:hypothetical protein n=1 Tax=Actinosynnema sp. NPDC053489 TaxID=3363916 RepID=UPI0037CC168A
MRTHLLHITAIRAACKRGRAQRELAGTLTSDATGQRELATLDTITTARLASAVDATTTEPADPTAAELPEVLALLAGELTDDEHGLVATAEMAARIGWQAKLFGEALRRASVNPPTPPRQRIEGSTNPVSVTDLDTVRTTITER